MSENMPDEVPDYDEFEDEELADAALATAAMDDDFDDDFESDADEDSGSNRSIIILIIAVAALILCGALAIILLVVRPFTPDEVPTLEATAAPVETPEQATPEGPGGLVDPVWERIDPDVGILVCLKGSASRFSSLLRQSCCRDYTQSRFRPLALRRLMTFLPPRVFIRARKP